jgi:hypothetical protein
MHEVRAESMKQKARADKEAKRAERLQTELTVCACAAARRAGRAERAAGLTTPTRRT